MRLDETIEEVKKYLTYLKIYVLSNFFLVLEYLFIFYFSRKLAKKSGDVSNKLPKFI